MIMKWVFKQFMRLQVTMYRRSGGKRFGQMRGMPLLLLTTVGRKSGVERVTPLMYTRDGDDYVVVASNNGAPTHPAWFLNLQAHPEVTIEVGETTYRMNARQATSAEKARMWPPLAEKAPFYENYRKKTTRDIPMVILQAAGN